MRLVKPVIWNKMARNCELELDTETSQLVGCGVWGGAEREQRRGAFGFAMEGGRKIVGEDG